MIVDVYLVQSIANAYFYKLIIDYLLNTGQPLVTIICLCYNQGRFVKESLLSAVNQTYPHIQLIVVDDASGDDSVAQIQEFIQEYSHVQFVRNVTNQGNCRSFNQALSFAKGKYIIDLAADDVLLDTRVEKQVTVFEQLGKEWGVIFSNTLFINERSQIQGYHYPVNGAGKAKKPIPSGDVYADILRHYFISTPTMMIRKEVLDNLGGYDENLSYEDFDFWVRSSRLYKYYYQDETLTLKRRVKGSLSTKFYKVRKNELLHSTLVVCQKALCLNKTSAENEALAICVRYHLRQSFYTQNFDLVLPYAELLRTLHALDSASQAIVWLAQRQVNVTGIYRMYLKLLNALPK